jgi:CHASE3 domain sensor protein
MAEQIRRRQRARAGLHDLEDVNAPLRVRAAHEYAYVARDVRRIVVTGGIMVAILAVIAVLVNVVGVITF